jgi:two-component system response regulator YesN
MLKVLIVEDEEIIRKGLVLTINWFELGCEVIGAAKDGVEGLKMIIETEPDIVIADIKMPFIDGLEMIEEAEKEVVFKSILLTSYTEFGYAQKGIQLQVSGYLLKPVNEEELKSTIERIQAEIDEELKHSDKD